MELSFSPTLDRTEAMRRLDRLLVTGSLYDGSVAGRVDRLAAEFGRYASCYPLPLWAPGLVLNNEMRGLTEALLPMAEIRPVFELLLRRGCRFEPFIAGTYLYSSPTWLDFLQKLRPQLRQADPGATLRQMARDFGTRLRFLFSLMLPHHFGGGFDRYPLQSEWIAEWLGGNRERLGGGVRALDSACGSGEGTYGLAELVVSAGYNCGVSEVDGSTLEPIELFAAAHAFFPHDPEREVEYRARVAPLLGGNTVRMEFYLDDVEAEGAEGGYDLILCNGLLGGPLLHEEPALRKAVAALTARLAPGGVLLAADRFHEGWRLRVTEAALIGMLREQGLAPLDLPEGIGGRKG